MSKKRKLNIGAGVKVRSNQVNHPTHLGIIKGFYKQGDKVMVEVILTINPHIFSTEVVEVSQILEVYPEERE